MDVLSHLASGFAAALTPTNLLMAVLGSLLGTLVGVLPGLGPTAAIAILFPLTAVLPPVPAIIMLAGIYYGAMYGGSTTAILLNIPGEVASVPTCLDGYPMAQQGRGGVALGISAIGSFFAGTLGVVALTFFAPFLADQALRFGPPEYFGLMVLAFTVIASLSAGSLIKGFSMAFLGYFISLIGLGPSTAEPRFTFGWGLLMSGVDLIALVVGLFAISEVFIGLEEARVAITQKIGDVFPRLTDVREAFPAILRGTGIGFFLGLLPGCAPGVTVFLAYDAEKKLSKHPERSARAPSRACDARKMVPVTSAHLTGDPESMGAAGLAFVEDLARQGVRFVVPTTTNARNVDFDRYRELGQPEDVAAKERRLRDLVVAMGGIALDSCTNYQSICQPRFGEHLAWGDTGTVIYANAVAGARSNFEGGPASYAAPHRTGRGLRHAPARVPVGNPPRRGERPAAISHRLGRARGSRGPCAGTTRSA
jgi:TctA family transporter